MNPGFGYFIIESRRILRRIFLNTHGTNADEVPEELVDFLNYVEHSCLPAAGEDDLLQRLQSRISTLKHSRVMEERYMLFGEMLDDERREGREEGREEGRTSMLSLIEALMNDGRTADIPRLSKEPEFLKEMLEAYHIEA